MSAQLRPVARMEKESNSILRVEDIEVGLRLRYPYLLTPLQLYIYEKPYRQFAANLRLAGRLSRDPKFGSGFVRLFCNRLEVPTRDWEAFDRGEDVPTETETIPFTAVTIADIVGISGRAHEQHARRLIVELTETLRARWFADSSIHEVCLMAIDELSDVPEMPVTTITHFEEWVNSMLQNTLFRGDNHAQPL